uniref:Uncharacterized protein n=1 Tax=uncultured marine virus TaxID=186617 RepID=A0A0F7L8G0_9VIRU|nr:hypothetical protein [uncultured marine virus]
MTLEPCLPSAVPVQDPLSKFLSSKLFVVITSLFMEVVWINIISKLINAVYRITSSYYYC